MKMLGWLLAAGLVVGVAGGCSEKKSTMVCGKENCCAQTFKCAGCKMDMKCADCMAKCEKCNMTMKPAAGGCPKDMKCPHCNVAMKCTMMCEKCCAKDKA